MKMRNKWILAIAAVIIMAVTWLDNDFSAFENLSSAALAPVTIITVVTFLVKAGVLSALLIGLKKLWEYFRKNE